jgi:hypothetical protein
MIEMNGLYRYELNICMQKKISLPKQDSNGTNAVNHELVLTTGNLNCYCSNFFTAYTTTTTTHASETWVLKKQIEEKLLVFERKIIRRIYGPTVDPNGLRRRTNKEINILLKQRNIVKVYKSSETCMVGTSGKNA